MNRDEELDRAIIDIRAALGNLQVAQDTLRRRLHRAEREQELRETRPHIINQQRRQVHHRSGYSGVSQPFDQPQSNRNRGRRPLEIGDRVRVTDTHPTRAHQRGTIIRFTSAQAYIQGDDPNVAPFRVWRNNLRRIRPRESQN